MQNLRQSPMPQKYIYVALLWAVIADVHPSDWNAALRKPAFQKSTNCNAVATRATDGEVFEKYDNTCSITKGGEPVTWWMVDLLGLYRIEEVHISNIGDNRSDWLANFRIEVFIKDPRVTADKAGQICYTRNGSRIGTGVLKKACPTPLLGRFVRIIKNNTQPLVLCEVMVWTNTTLGRYSSYRKLLDPEVGSTLAFNNVSSLTMLQCAFRCTELRDSGNCWGFNWFPEHQLCHLLAPAPLNSSIEGYELDGGHLYVENSQINNQTLDNC